MHRPVLLAFVLALVVALTPACTPSESSTPTPPGRPSTSDARTDAIEVLRAWDEGRARAFAAGDPRALRALYLPGSAAGRRDDRLLRRYAARGLRVTGMQPQLLAVGVRRQRPGRLVLAVTERLTGAVATGPDGAVRLPRSAPRTRVVTLVERPSGWIVAAVRRG